MLSEAILKIENQRKDFTKGGLEDSVAQVLLHLCRELPALAAAVAASDKTLKDCVGHLKDYAMKHQTGGCGTIDAEIGTKLFCEFYGADWLDCRAFLIRAIQAKNTNVGSNHTIPELREMWEAVKNRPSCADCEFYWYSGGYTNAAPYSHTGGYDVWKEWESRKIPCEMMTHYCRPDTNTLHKITHEPLVFCSKQDRGAEQEDTQMENTTAMATTATQDIEIASVVFSRPAMEIHRVLKNHGLMAEDGTFLEPLRLTGKEITTMAETAKGFRWVAASKTKLEKMFVECKALEEMAEAFNLTVEDINKQLKKMGLEKAVAGTALSPGSIVLMQGNDSIIGIARAVVEQATAHADTAAQEMFNQEVKGEGLYALGRVRQSLDELARLLDPKAGGGGGVRLQCN